MTAHTLAGKLQTQRVACGRATGKCKKSSGRGWRLSFLHPAQRTSLSLTQVPRRPGKTHRGFRTSLRDVGGLYLAGSGERQQRLERLRDCYCDAQRFTQRVALAYFLLRRLPFFQSGLCACKNVRTKTTCSLKYQWRRATLVLVVLRRTACFGCRRQSSICSSVSLSSPLR